MHNFYKIAAMKKIFLILFSSIIVGSLYSQDGHPVTPAVSKIDIEKLTAADWQADLHFLQHIVHKEYSFLFKKITPAAFDAEVLKLYNNIPSL